MKLELRWLSWPNRRADLADWRLSSIPCQHIQYRRGQYSAVRTIVLVEGVTDELALTLAAGDRDATSRPKACPLFRSTAPTPSAASCGSCRNQHAAVARRHAPDEAAELLIHQAVVPRDISGPSSRRSIYSDCLHCSWITLSLDELERRNCRSEPIDAGFPSAFPLRQTLARRLPYMPIGKRFLRLSAQAVRGARDARRSGARNPTGSSRRAPHRPATASDRRRTAPRP